MIKKSRISDKQIKLIDVVAVVVVVVGVLLWGMVPNEIYEVNYVFNHMDELNGREISVRGVVKNFDISLNEFQLKDPDSSEKGGGLSVVYNGSFPDGFGNNQSVIVKGVYSAGLNQTISSRQIIIGCPSKY